MQHLHGAIYRCYRRRKTDLAMLRAHIRIFLLQKMGLVLAAGNQPDMPNVSRDSNPHHLLQVLGVLCDSIGKATLLLLNSESASCRPIHVGGLERGSGLRAGLIGYRHGSGGASSSRPDPGIGSSHSFCTQFKMPNGALGCFAEAHHRAYGPDGAVG